MPAVELEDTRHVRDLVGQEIAVTEWFEVDQSRIDQFAEATEDRQWIHLDPERARRESPYRTTIAHGFLTLSLLSCFIKQAVTFRTKPRLVINYGLNRVRFPGPVPSGARIRARVTPQAFEDFSGSCQITWGFVVEREGAEKPCCVAEWLMRYYT